ncbi:hypothetical protein SEVIR_1G378000v4 [Setaria viridis]|uniref:Uncharacterized protein n=1 Tax=Setaria viridis TaxID=4556 RepID=A0A4U6WL71_SETVI|nr:hypothetical protein SEVIR_1G378000v2 [Setaria viridis]
MGPPTELLCSSSSSQLPLPQICCRENHHNLLCAAPPLLHPLRAANDGPESSSPTPATGARSPLSLNPSSSLSPRPITQMPKRSQYLLQQAPPCEQQAPPCEQQAQGARAKRGAAATSPMAKGVVAMKAEGGGRSSVGELHGRPKRPFTYQRGGELGAAAACSSPGGRERFHSPKSSGRTHAHLPRPPRAPMLLALR